MSSIPGLPPTGSDVTVVVTRVNSNPLCVLVELWAKFSQEREADYQRMESSIQCPGQLFREFDGNPGDHCLARVDDTWYRSRIVLRNGANYRVFLIDKGWTLGATTNMLAWGEKHYFHLEPEVEFCVLSNVLPLSPDNKWSPMALEFLKSLSGRTVRAMVQDVLVPQRTFLLHIACISTQMHEMGFAKCLSPHKFKDYVLKAVHSDNKTVLSPGLPQKSAAKKPLHGGEFIEKPLTFMYPELPTGTVETVVITEVTNPLRVFCQLKVFSQELKKLAEKITQHYEGRPSTYFGPHTLGSVCAARGSDGQWYRSVLQQILPAKNAVEVFNVDYGKKQIVLVDNVKPLSAEFFRMPVVTYITSLHGIIDKGVGWTARQIGYLRSLLLYKTVIAKFEYQSLSEGVHYVTMYDEDNKNMNTLFGSTEHCLLDSEKLLVDYAVDDSLVLHKHQALREAQEDTHTSAKAVMLIREKTPRELPVEDLPLSVSLNAVVLHVTSPSEFWIQTQKYAIEFDHLMDGISELDRDPANQNKVENATVGLYCAARAHDGIIYRSMVVEVSETQIKVFLVDYGKTEFVDRCSIRFLPDKFRELPQLAFKCELAGVKPRNETWIHPEVNFFTKSVTDKLLNVQVVTKHDGGYVVRLTDSVAHGENDVGKLMCSYGFAVKDEAQSEPKSEVAFPCANLPMALNCGTAPLGVNKNSCCDFQIQNLVEVNKYDSRSATFKEHMFPIGSTLEVNVSCIESPNDFWCQLVQNITHLKLLMQDMQAYYGVSQFHPFAEKACVARHPDNGMWYRAIVIQKHLTPHVDVLFVDYGDMKAAVPLHDLRTICPAFLTLKGQAFRCSLYNPEEPSSPLKDWNQEARAQFQEFVETAVSKHVALKCTVYAIMYSDQKVLCNIVDLETPFESVCTRMLQLSKNTPPKKVPGPSFRLDTYCYSAHNIKMGTEEMMTVTSVDNTNQFYCQLNRNLNVVEDLTVKLHNLCEQLKSAKLPTLLGTVCFAKYPDGRWYRGLIRATQPSFQVFFVDYGDTLEVDKADILPIPMEATDIMSVPVQAIKCGLSDIPANVQNEVNSWFKTNATDYSFRALVVAKEPCGKLLVELYHGTSQMNSEIKNNFLKAVPKCVPGLKDDTQAPKRKPLPDPDPVPSTQDDVKVSRAISWSENKLSQCIVEKSKPQPMELYKMPHQRNITSRIPGGKQQWTDPVDAGTTRQIKRYAPEHPQQHVASKVLCTESQESQVVVVVEPKKQAPTRHTDQSEESKALDVKAEPQRYLLPNFSEGQQLEAYVSTITGPHSFWCQPADSEELDRITLDLSEVGSGAHKPVDPKLLCGSPCVALFPDDGQWYRAEVISMDGNMLSAHFVDYGNDSQVNVKDVREAPPELVQTEVQAFLCELDGFDDAKGSWTDGAVDHMSQLVMGKLLELTVIKVLGEGNGKYKCMVQVLCEGNLINAMARAYWKSSRTENNLDATGLSALHPTSLPCDSSVKGHTVPQSQREAEEPENDTMEELESPRVSADEQRTVDSEKSEEPSILSEMDMASEPTLESTDQTMCSLQSTVADGDVLITSDAQFEDGATPPSDNDQACQLESLSNDESVVKADQDCEHVTIDDHDSGPDCYCLEVTPASRELYLDSEFGRLRVAEALPVGAPCIIWSHTVQQWCQARILKNLKDCTMVVLIDEDVEMSINPESIFESVGPQSDQLDDNNNQSVSAHTEAAEQNYDSDDTLVGVDEMVQENMLSTLCVPSLPSTAAPEEVSGTADSSTHTPAHDEEHMPSTQQEVQMPSAQEVAQSTPLQEEGLLPPSEQEVHIPSRQEKMWLTPLSEEEVVSPTQQLVIEEEPSQSVEEHCVLAAGREPAGDESPADGRPLQETPAGGHSPGPGPEDEQVTAELQPLEAPRRDVEDLLETGMLSSDEQSLEAHLSSVTHLSLVINDNSDDNEVCRPHRLQDE